MKRISALLLAILVLAAYSPFMQTAKSTLPPIVLLTSNPDVVAIYFLDVGQGDSILVKTPTKNILIDGGPSDAGSALLADLNAYQVTKIDLMVATHPHADHIGGLISVLQSNINVQDIVYNGYNYTTTQTFNTWKSLALSHNLTQGNRNQVYTISPTVNFTVLSPTGPLQFSDINAESIVMKLQVGNTSIMLTGDAQFDTEQYMVSSGLNLQSQVLKVGHHGSSTSTSQTFLSAITPTYAVISAGIDNSYGHPTQQTLDILTSNNIATYGTYTYGTVIFSLNPATSTPTPSPSLTPTSSPSANPTPSLSPDPTTTFNPTLSPTANPTDTTHPTTNTPTQTPITIPNNSQTSTPRASPSIPELSTLITLTLLLIIISAVITALRQENYPQLFERVVHWFKGPTY